MTRRRIALYLRVSTDEQDTERQERDLRAWCERAGWEVVACEREHASGANDARKARARLLQMAKRRECDAIAVCELSRWSRSTIDLLSTLQTLASHGCSLCALNGQDFDFSTAAGKLMLTVLGAVAEFERELIRERTRSGMATARAKGKHIGRRAGSNVVQDRFRSRILELRANRLSIREIARACGVAPGTVSAVLKAATPTASKTPQ